MDVEKRLAGIDAIINQVREACVARAANLQRTDPGEAYRTGGREHSRAGSWNAARPVARAQGNRSGADQPAFSGLQADIAEEETDFG